MPDSDWKKVAEERDAALPSHCFDCGVVLMGGMTEHKPGCSIRKLIEENFPHGQKQTHRASLGGVAAGAAMIYDRDLARTRRLLLLVIAACSGTAAANLFAHQWLTGISCLVWAVASFVQRHTIAFYQDARDRARTLTAMMAVREENEK